MKISKLIIFPSMLVVSLLNPMASFADEIDTEQGENVETIQQPEQGATDERTASTGNLKESTQTFNDYFPDDNLADSVAATLGMQPTDPIDLEELSKMKFLDCADSNISDMSGLEYLPNLNTLFCYNNQLTTLDVSQNPNMTHLKCSGNSLTNLNVSQASNLSELYCYDNQLTSIDVSQNPKLTNFYCYNNPLTTLDVSQNPNLSDLYCSDNLLTALDVSQNPDLSEFQCFNNSLTTLDVSQNPNLNDLNCANNLLTTMDISQNPKMENFYCGNNQLTNLDVTHNPSLTDIDCSGNLLTTLDVSQNPDLGYLKCSSNLLPSLDISQNPDIKYLYCSNNQIQDFSFMNLIDPYMSSAGNQQVMAEKQMCEGGALTVPVSEDLKDETGASMNISVPDGGVYDAATNTITWTGLDESGTVQYDFVSDSGLCSGTVTVPYQQTEAVTLSADNEITYNVSDKISEQAFLQDIHATTEDGNQLSSDFETVVDFSTPGDYQVTLTASNQEGTKSVDKKMTVHIVKPKSNHTDQVVPSNQDATDQTVNDDSGKAKRVNADKTTSDQTVDSKTTTTQNATKVNQEDRATLPNTGDQSMWGWVLIGGIIVAAGYSLLRKKKVSK
ncbi:LapB repeat-containing protein [Listeria costaricensis]|uniref:LapB repeat-containing protein n=1 Tax=Listeria costaricensis TaxID=2026604 RepID=UPI0013C411C2|nr:LapB repeat-containing protein [Listeria costaricensis]